jgi:hypothetical protein
MLDHNKTLVKPIALGGFGMNLFGWQPPIKATKIPPANIAVGREKLRKYCEKDAWLPLEIIQKRQILISLVERPRARSSPQHPDRPPHARRDHRLERRPDLRGTPQDGWHQQLSDRSYRQSRTASPLQVRTIHSGAARDADADFLHAHSEGRITHPLFENCRKRLDHPQNFGSQYESLKSQGISGSSSCLNIWISMLNSGSSAVVDLPTS